MHKANKLTGSRKSINKGLRPTKKSVKAAALLFLFHQNLLFEKQQ